MEGLALRADDAKAGPVHANDTKAPRKNRCYTCGAEFLPAGGARTRYIPEARFVRPMCDKLSQLATSAWQGEFFALDHGFQGHPQRGEPAWSRHTGAILRPFLGRKAGRFAGSGTSVHPQVLLRRHFLFTRLWSQRNRTFIAARGWCWWSTLTRDERFLTVFVQLTAGIGGFWRFWDWPSECCHVCEGLWGEPARCIEPYPGCGIVNIVLFCS
jgi:hypothetical protein